MKVDVVSGKLMIVPEGYFESMALQQIAQSVKDKPFILNPITNNINDAITAIEIKEVVDKDKPNKNNGSKIASKDKNEPNRPPLTTK